MMILLGIDSSRTGIEQFTTHRMIAERLRAIHYPEVRGCMFIRRS